MIDKNYRKELDTAKQVLDIFKNLSIEDKLKIIGITDDLLLAQECNRYVSKQ